MKTETLASAIIFVFLGCAVPVTSVTRLGSKTYSPKPSDSQIAVLTNAPEGRKYEEIAIITVVTTQNMKDKSINAMLPVVTKEALGLGADAIILKNVEPGNPYGGLPSGRIYSVAIKYKD